MSHTILNDSIFIEFGGLTGTTTANMRHIAYAIAEERIGLYIGTFLEPTIVTGIFFYPWPDNRLILKQSDLISIHRTDGLINNNDDYSYESDEIYSHIVSHENSVIVVGAPSVGIFAGCTPDSVQLVYEAGLPPGTVTGSASYTLALVTLAQQFLDIIANPGSNTMFNQNIVSWSSMTHSETYSEPAKTFFGDTPVAAFVMSLLEGLRRQRGIKLP